MTSPLRAWRDRSGLSLAALVRHLNRPRSRTFLPRDPHLFLLDVQLVEAGIKSLGDILFPAQLAELPAVVVAAHQLWTHDQKRGAA